MQRLKKKTAGEPTRETPPRNKPKRKTVVLGTVSLMLAGAVVVGCAVLFAPSAQAAALTGTTTYGSLTQTLEGTAVTMPAESYTYATVSDAEILEVLVSAGDTVKKGDLLYVQDDSEVDDTIDGYRDQISDYEDQITTWQSQLADVQKELDEVTVEAPIAGRVQGVSLQAGDTVKKGDTLCTIVDDGAMTLTLYFSYAYEDRISLGQSAVLSVPDQMTSLAGTVTDIRKVERVTSEGTRCFAVTVTVENPGALTKGMSAGGYLVDGGETLYPAIEGTLEPQGEETVIAQCSGELLSVRAEDYDKVSSGATLFAVDGADYQAQMKTFSDQIARAGERIASLEERIAQEEEGRADYSVVSDLDGKVIVVRVQAGDTPQKGATAMAVYDLSKMSLTATIDELDIDYLSPGMTARIIRSGAEQDQEYEGVVTEVGMEATSSGGVATFPVTIEVDAGGALSAGVNVSYYITVGEDDSEGVLAPVAAVQYTDQGTCLFVEGDRRPENAIDLEDGTVPDGFYAIPVTVGTSSGRQVRILSGAEADMTVFLGFAQSAPSGGDTTSEGQDGVESAMPGGFPGGEFPSGGFPASGSGMPGGMGGGRQG